jgi:hypothetical protein
VWILALDVTPSISKPHFQTLRDRMIPGIVIARLHSREVLHVLEIDSNPEDQQRPPQRLEVSPTQLGLATATAGLYADHLHTIAQRAHYRGDTNIGGVLAYAHRIAATIDATDSQHAQLIVAIFTDGKLEGKQTMVDAAWPANVRVWFWGVLSEYEVSLTTWATTDMKLREGQVRVVRLSDWETEAVVFGHAIERPFPDPHVVKQVYARRAPGQQVVQQGPSPVQ